MPSYQEQQFLAAEMKQKKKIAKNMQAGGTAGAIRVPRMFAFCSKILRETVAVGRYHSRSVAQSIFTPYLDNRVQSVEKDTANIVRPKKTKRLSYRTGWYIIHTRWDLCKAHGSKPTFKKCAWCVELHNEKRGRGESKATAKQPDGPSRLVRSLARSFVL